MGKHTIQITDDKLYEDIISYCKVNDLKIGTFCTDMLKKQLAMEQYGDIPFGDFTKKEEPVGIKLTTQIDKTEITKPTGNPLNPFETTVVEDKFQKNTEETISQTLKPRKRRL